MQDDGQQDTRTCIMFPDHKTKNLQTIELHVAQDMSPDAPDVCTIDNVNKTVAMAITHITHFFSTAPVVRGPSMESCPK